MSAIRTVVVPHDFSEFADAALDVAAELAQALSATLHLVHVLQPPAYIYSAGFYAGGPMFSVTDERRSLRETTTLRLEAIAREYRPTDPSIRIHVVEGSGIADAIDHEAARLVADLIVMGTHGRTGLAHLLLGSVAEETLRRAPCPVLTVPRHKRVHIETLKRIASREPTPGAF